MHRQCDSHFGDPLEVDANTAERLLAGELGAEDAPPAYAAVARVLEAASNPTATGEERLGEAALLAAYRGALVASARSRARADAPAPVRSRRRWIAAAMTAGALALTGGAAAAVTAAQSDPASPARRSEETPSSTVGINGAENSGAHNDRTDGEGVQNGESQGQGSTVSSIAQDPTWVGIDKGIAVCTAASDERCHAGEHGDATEVRQDDTPARGQDHRPDGQADNPPGGGQVPERPTQSNRGKRP